MSSVEVCLANAVQFVDSASFPEALIELMNHLVPNDNIALLGFFQDRSPELFFARSKTPEVHADLESSYLNGAYLLDPLHELHVSQAPAAVYRLEDVAPDQFSKNQYFIDYYARTTMVDEIAFVSHPNSGVSLQLCLGRDRASGKKFTQKQLRIAREWHPTVTAFLNRQWSNLNTEGSFDQSETLAVLIERSQTEYKIKLTFRQAEIIFLILKGHSSNSIALRLGISYQTVKVFRRQIYKKCRISSQGELFSMFVPLLGSGRRHH